MIYNVYKLGDELRAAGLPGGGACASNGRIDLGPGWSYHPGQAPANAVEQKAADVLAAHDPSQTREQRLAARGFSPLQAALVLVVREGLVAPAWAKALVAAEGDRLATEEP